MTSCIIPIILIISLSAPIYGMDCSFGTSSNIFQEIVSKCPQPLQSSSKSYCCLDSDHQFYCCDIQEFTLNTGLGIVLPGIIGVVVVVTFFVLCITCLCCSCCPWYKRRHRGTVYGKVVTPGVVVVQQPATTVPVPNQRVQPPYPQYTVHPTVSSMQYTSQPPPYTAEPYAQQSPYNPNFPNK